MPESPVSASPVSGNSASGTSDSQWDEIFDVVVVGSGGGALTAALLAARGGASTLVVEKDEFFGGTTAVSTETAVPVEADRIDREEKQAHTTKKEMRRARSRAPTRLQADRSIEHLAVASD